MSLEPWQYIEKIPRDNYFMGYIKFKLRGEFNEYISENEKADYFYKLEFYDIEFTVNDEESDFGFSLSETKNRFLEYQKLSLNPEGIVLNYKSEKYTCHPAEIRLIEGSNSLGRKHTMVEGSEVHSYFETKACIILRDYTETILCKEGYLTGNEEIEFRENVEFKRSEYFTNSCEKKWGNWVQVGTSCVPGSPTGKKENNLDQCQYREEFYNFDCSTYWGEWKKIEGLEGKATGRTRKIHGFSEAEYHAADCEKIWKKIDKPTVEFVGCLSMGGGCLSQILGILLFTILAISLLPQIAAGVFFWIIPLLVWGLIYLFSRSSIIGSLVEWLFRIFGYLFFAALLALIAFSLYSILSDRMPDREWIVPERENDDHQEYRLDSISTDTSDSLIYHTRTWYDYSKNKYTGSYYVRTSELTQSENNLNQISWLYEIGSVYKNLSNYDAPKLASIYEMLDSINIKNSLSEVEFAEVIVSFVQDIEYWLILELSCEASNLGPDELEILATGVNCEGYSNFGLRTPTQFMADLKGDCDTRTVLLYTILKHFKYDVVILNSDFYGHSMLGINLPLKGDYKYHDGKVYYFWETTNTGFPPGLLPPDFGNLNYWYISLE
jgi:hypothetical protein